MPARSFIQYREMLRKVAIEESNRTGAFPEDQAYRIDVTDQKKNGLCLVSAEQFTFNDRAVLDFNEVIALEDGEIRCSEYSYQYQRQDLYFRYEKDPYRVSRTHPLCHAHINAETPRWITGQVNFEEVLTFILSTWYR